MKKLLSLSALLFFISIGISGTLTSYDDMVDIIKSVSDSPYFKITKEGKSVEGRVIYSVNINRGSGKKQWKVLLYAQQHGNEPAGKEALLKLIQEINRNPNLLSKNIDLYIVPMVNPDGAELNTRRNANNYDLNRDHQRLSQPEINILHNIFRRIMPHMAVDCHEFGRDSEDYAEKGWSEWPLIMMDCSNSPIMGNEIYEAALEWIEGASRTLNKKGINFSRYYVGNAPPEGELRYSTTEMDDGRNGLGAYGGLSFIIESGVKRNVEIEDEDLTERVEAYYELFDFLLSNSHLQRKHRDLIEDNWTQEAGDFLPVNYFWGNVLNQVTPVKVIDLKTNGTKEIPTADFVNDLIVKKTVSKPLGYVIPANVAKPYLKLMKKHNIPYNILQKSKSFRVEPVKLSKLETEWDETYSRYGNRQIVEKLNPETMEFSSGSLIVELTGPDSRRAALHLEPNMLYGLYQYPEFRELAPDGNIIPVYRIID